MVQVVHQEYRVLLANPDRRDHMELQVLVDHQELLEKQDRRVRVDQVGLQEQVVYQVIDIKQHQLIV